MTLGVGPLANEKDAVLKRLRKKKKEHRKG